VTFVIAKITHRDSGQVSLLADTKLSDTHDETLNRQTLTHPFQKVVIISDDVVIGFAGDTPDLALERLVALRGQSAAAIEETLQSYTAEMRELGASKKFLVVERTPSVRIVVIANGEREDRTDIGTGWIGDREAFEVYSSVYQSAGLQQFAEAQRLFMSMVNLVDMEDVDTVGGFIVRVAGRPDRPFRFMADPGFVLPDYLEAIVDQQSVEFRLAQGADPTSHQRFSVPGAGATYSALAHYIPEAGTAWLHTHEEPWRNPEKLRVESIPELVAVAEAEHHQVLDPADAEYMRDKYGQQ
jgi:hypothetical protein